VGFAPVFAEAAASLEPRLRLAKVDTEAQPALAQRFGIRSIPTLLVMRQGREVARQAGALNGMQLRQFLANTLR
jgi:thioredoxin 2